MSPASALAYLCWTRHRRGLTFLGCYWLAAMIFCLVVPVGYFKSVPDVKLWFAVSVYASLCFTFVSALGYLILLFTFGREARLQACESGYPARLWTLPLPTRALVGWPVLWGSVTMIFSWVTLGWVAGRPYGYDMPLIWPALLLAAFLAWWQAILWMPLPLPWLRFLLVILVSTLLVFAPIALLQLEAPSIIVSGTNAFLLFTACLTAIWGAARARRGDNVPWEWPAWLRRTWAATGARRPFASPIHAQRWFEWRSHGLAFPVIVATFVVLELPLIPFVAKFLDDADTGMKPLIPPRLLHQIGSLWVVLFGLLAGMPFLALGFGIDMGRFGKKTYRLPAFVGTLPVSEVLLVRAKFESAARRTLAGWGALALALLFWFALGGHSGEAAQQFEAMRQRQAPGIFWGGLILLVGGSLVLTWLQMVQGMWIGLTGNTRLIERSGFTFIAFANLIAVGIWLAYRSGYGSVLIRLLPWLAGAAVVLKSLAATWSLRALGRRQLILPPVLWGILLIWLTLAAGLFAALYALIPEEWFSVSGVVLGMVLLLPMTRLALAPLALSWNRHR